MADSFHVLHDAADDSLRILQSRFYGDLLAQLVNLRKGAVE